VFHQPFRADEWLLYECYSPVASGAGAWPPAGFFTEDGRLVATTVQRAWSGSPRTDGCRACRLAAHCPISGKDFRTQGTRVCCMQSDVTFRCDDGLVMPGVLTTPDGQPDAPRPGLLLIYEVFG